MNTEYLSMYFIFFLSLQFFSFPHISLKHILFYLYLSISFGGDANVNGIVFDFTFHLFTADIEKLINILTLYPATLL